MFFGGNGMGGLTSVLGMVVEKTVDFISSLGYWGIAVGMAVESANIPLPSEVILPFGGYLASTGRLDFSWAALAGAIGGTAGSAISYFLGCWGGRPLLLRYGRYFGFSPRHLAVAEEWFRRYGEATVFFTRFLPVVRTFISFPAGISRMNFFRFLLYTFAGSLPWCFFLTYLGFKLGQHWQDIEHWFRRFDIFIVVLAVLLILCLWLRKKKSQN